MSGRLGSFSLPNLSPFIVKVLAGEYLEPSFAVFACHFKISSMAVTNLRAAQQTIGKLGYPCYPSKAANKFMTGRSHVKIAATRPVSVFAAHHRAFR